MMTLSKITTAAALAVTAASGVVAVPADARTRHRHYYHGRTYYTPQGLPPLACGDGHRRRRSRRRGGRP